MDVATGEIILLDVQAKHSVANASEPIRFVYENKVEKQTTAYGQDAMHITNQCQMRVRHSPLQLH